MHHTHPGFSMLLLLLLCLLGLMIPTLAYLLACLSPYLPIYLPAYLPTYLPTYLPIYLPTYIPSANCMTCAMQVFVYTSFHFYPSSSFFTCLPLLYVSFYVSHPPPSLLHLLPIYLLRLPSTPSSILSSTSIFISILLQLSHTALFLHTHTHTHTLLILVWHGSVGLE
ncbi:hypothetical protein BO70DRAFT_100925 [Aspergillus heteromorphus CBS 117.55]|uniref:Uncharacterized protein n=1 Tax=Aspergillus heteromorphus CBS 117.55 TaxID=1448321 RepID=A0A317VMG4_9EURO|nr:uncharacterized protein BO70DRAFT_100925 [Aspergillus heteromorphus CBS 117.55]PWY75085.1 hypothetical protein BO70DRAFT_100925 [Aspergillus heteromorphus CBS 117.55]